MRTRRGLCYPKPNPNPNPNPNPTQTHFPNKRCRTNANGGSHQNKINNNKNFQSCFPNLISPPFPNNINTKNSVNNLPKMEISGDKSKYYNRVPSRKRSRTSNEKIKGPDLFDNLPDDLIITILSKLSSSVACPADFINVLLTCKRLNGLGMNSTVLSKASLKSLTIKARNWSENAHKFLKLCSDAGNVEASYLLGMIRFYCLQNRGSGASLMAKAAINSHPHALYSLAVIQFNGSGGTKSDKDLRAGVALCARAAFLGHVDALRELGHCLQDGYGVRQNVTEGRRFLVQANARELATALSITSSATSSNSYWLSHPPTAARHVSPATMNSVGCPLLSDFGCNVPPLESHPANQFLAEWFGCWSRFGLGLGSGLRLCSHSGCGRPETRRHEFRRCSVCGVVNYCSRACQALDWKLRHKVECAPMERWVDGNGNGDVDGGVNGDDR